MKTGRNDPCPCGSGQKYKKCCVFKDEAAKTAEIAAQAATRAAAEEAEAAAQPTPVVAKNAGVRPTANTAPKLKGPPAPKPALMRKHGV